MLEKFQPLHEIAAIINFWKAGGSAREDRPEPARWNTSSAGVHQPQRRYGRLPEGCENGVKSLLDGQQCRALLPNISAAGNLARLKRVGNEQAGEHRDKYQERTGGQD